MQYVKLGSTGLDVSRICLGCMTYGLPDRGVHEWTLDEEASRPLIRQALEAGANYVDLYQIHRYDHATPVEETMEALHDLVKAGKVRYIGASSMYAWEFSKAQYTAERHGWTKFVSMQNHYNLLYREEEREMLPLCADQGVSALPWSPLARGRLTRDWGTDTERSANDDFGSRLYLDSDRAIVEA